jgi:hypothetical protein
MSILYFFTQNNRKIVYVLVLDMRKLQLFGFGFFLGH